MQTKPESAARNPLIAQKSRAGLWIFAIFLMALCVIATAWFPIASITSLPSANYNEGWNAYRQWMALKSQPLYAAPPSEWTTNYPFLSFHIIAAIGKFFGVSKTGMVHTGRTVSFLSLIATCALNGGIIRLATGSKAAALYASLALFAYLASFYGAGRAADDPELLSLAFTSLALFAYFKTLFSGRTEIWITLCAIAFALSLFTKHDLIAFPLSIAAHLLITKNWRPLATFLTTGIIAAFLLLAASNHLDGPYFFAALLQPRAYGLQNLISETLHYLLHFSIPLLIALAVIIPGREIPARSLLLILLIFTNLIAIYFSGGDGVASNIFYPPLLADLLACVIAISATSRYFQTALALTTLTAVAMSLSQLHVDAGAERRMPAATQAAQRAIAELASTNGPAICEDLLLCYQADKPIDYDPYYVKDQILIHRIQQNSILAAITAQHYAAIQIEGSMAQELLAARHGGRFTAPILDAILQNYQPSLADHFYTVLTPIPQNPGSNLSRITKSRAAGG